MKIQARESVIFANDFYKLVEWYKTILGFKVTHLVEDDYHYSYLENEVGIQLGIADAQEMGVTPGQRTNNTVVLQFQVGDVQAFFDHLQANQGQVTFGPSYDKKDGFWFGGFQDIEGNPVWVVDDQCP